MVLSPLRNDEVGKTLRGFDELLVHGLEHLEVAVDDHLGRTSPFLRVTPHDANEPLVGVGIHENLQVHEVAQPGIPQRHDALDDDDLAGLHVDRLLQSVADEEAVGGLLDGLALAQVFHLLDEERPVEGIGVVEVDLTAFLHAEERGVVVVRILGDEGYLVAG